MNSSESERMHGLLRALRFAAEKHRDQRRKGDSGPPYINHPIEVAELLAQSGIDHLPTLQAAVLHDTIEDTETSPEEIEREFGAEVRDIVLELTDDKSLPKHERKRLQVERAGKKSPAAQSIKIADKTCNVRDVTENPPSNWPLERRVEYLDWAESVVKGCRGANETLEARFDQALHAGRTRLG